MKITQFSRYEFKEYNLTGIKAEINFSKKNNLKIILHEELATPIEDQDTKLINEFEPLLFSVDMETLQLLESKELDIDLLTLLDGHHRFDFISRNNIDSPIKVIIISSEDVNVDPYLAEVNIELEKFKNLLVSKNFTTNSDSDFYLKIDNDIYSSNEISSIYDLYDFKRECFKEGFITPFANDNEVKNENIVSFTPIKLNQFYKENYLFPPKSTWITPRI